MRIILASGSPRRTELLHQVGLEHEIIKSEVEEVVDSNVPSEVVCSLSRQKAFDVYQRQENKKDILVIGADTVVAYDNRILGKPKDEADAFAMLKQIAGSVHSVYTGVTLVQDGKINTFYEETKVWVYDMTDEEITEYIRTGEPMDKAGAYGIQGRFAAYIQRISGDYNNVVGLPVGRICEELRRRK